MTQARAPTKKRCVAPEGSACAHGDVSESVANSQPLVSRKFQTPTPPSTLHPANIASAPLANYRVLSHSKEHLQQMVKDLIVETDRGFLEPKTCELCGGEAHWPRTDFGKQGEDSTRCLLKRASRFWDTFSAPLANRMKALKNECRRPTWHGTETREE